LKLFHLTGKGMEKARENCSVELPPRGVSGGEAAREFLPRRKKKRKKRKRDQREIKKQKKKKRAEKPQRAISIEKRISQGRTIIGELLRQSKKRKRGKRKRVRNREKKEPRDSTGNDRGKGRRKGVKKQENSVAWEKSIV